MSWLILFALLNTSFVSGVEIVYRLQYITYRNFYAVPPSQGKCDVGDGLLLIHWNAFYKNDTCEKFVCYYNDGDPYMEKRGCLYVTSIKPNCTAHYRNGMFPSCCRGYVVCTS